MMYSYRPVSLGVRRGQIPIAPCQLCECETRLRISQADARSLLLEVCLTCGYERAPGRKLNMESLDSVVCQALGIVEPD